jgi:hypothetical protein
VKTLFRCTVGSYAYLITQVIIANKTIGKSLLNYVTEMLNLGGTTKVGTERLAPQCAMAA